MTIDVTFKQDEALNVNLVQSGKDGLSAYEVAVKNGYEGTEEEWLASLKPVKGKDYFTEADIAEIQDGVEVCKTFTYDATLTMDTATLTNTYTVDATTDISDLITWVNAGKPVKIDFNVDGTTKNVFTGILSNSTGAIANYNIGTINANNFAYQQLIIMEGQVFVYVEGWSEIVDLSSYSTTEQVNALISEAIGGVADGTY